jgi:hypothetical protein
MKTPDKKTLRPQSSNAEITDLLQEAVKHLIQKEWEIAIQIAKEIRKKFPSNLSALHILIMANIFKSNLQQSLIYYKEACDKKKPSRAYYIAILELLHLQLNNEDNIRFVNLDPNNSNKFKFI